ncbi:hypothetical protein [Natranaerofaba carboxydovora]|uniref:hypothetical protein n=1 Tax=Natranaerofaba carboxydovora TaxID=2742683 RepID=UPI001F137C2B|nr:hypothetical protein [Natranaerofaba carboxydovora]UMZ73716.1 hypothetical protein ACONDI_01282 [Natranaerofaba carboxydovora]
MNFYTCDSEFYKCEDGVIRWIYELSLWKNPTIIISLLKVFLLASFFPVTIVGLITLFESGFVEAFKASLTVFGIILPIMLALLALSYPIVAILYGGKYCVLFEMDEVGVKHNQLDKNIKKSQAINILGIAAGIVSSNPTIVGAGVLSYFKKSSYSEFSKVRKIVTKKRRSVIYLNEFLERNQVYVPSENFDMVLDYIVSRCNGAVVKKG